VTPVEDVKCSGHPFIITTGENVDHVKECILKNREALSMSLLNMLGGILFSSVHILKDSPRGGIQGIYFFSIIIHLLT
jgi:hypothetical protein